MSQTMLEVPPKPAAQVEKRRTLFQIGGDARALELLLEEVEGDITGCDTIIDAWLSETEGALKEKLDGYCALVKESDARAKARKEEAKRLTELAAADENRAARLKHRLLEFFQVQKIDKVQTARYIVAKQKNGGVRAVTLLVPVAELPKKYQVPIITADTLALREVLLQAEADAERLRQLNESLVERGLDPEPPTLVDELAVAKLEPQGDHIRIR